MKLFDFLHNTKTQAILAFVLLAGGGLLIKFGMLPDNDRNRIFDLMFLTATFYFGSSKSGSAKDDTIANLANNQNNPIATTNSGDVTVKQ